MLFFLSRELTRSFTRFMFHLFKSKRITVTLLALLFFPGTLIHELSHYLMARLLFVHAGNMHLLPRIEGDGVILGSVGIGRSDIFRRMLIGAAPFIFGTTLLLLTLFYVTKEQLWENPLSLTLAGFVIFQIGNTMFSSKRDREGMVLFLIITTVIAILLYIAGLRIPVFTLSSLITADITEMFERGSVLLLFPILLDIVIITVFKLITRLFS